MDTSQERETNLTSIPAPLGLPLTKPTSKTPVTAKQTWWTRVHVGKLFLFLISLSLFVVAIALMKEGARDLAPWVQDTFQVENAANSLGFGWFFAYLIMSGSPVAAAALTFFDAGVINQLGAFAMITGSRLGASFIVLFIGFLYVLRGRDRATSLSMGLVSLTVTATTYIPGLVLGALILRMGWLDHWQLQSGMLLSSAVDRVVDPVVLLITTWLPEWMIFFIGLAIILISFKFFDKCLPQMTIKESQVGWMSRLVYRPWVMFILGAMVTLISMSVSLSLSILVPLSTRGFVSRENVIPYIMGANITTFIDSLLAAVLLSNPPAFTVVFVEMISVMLISLLILIFIYGWYSRRALKFVGWVTVCNRNLAIFMGGILLIPIFLLFL